MVALSIVLFNPLAVKLFETVAVPVTDRFPPAVTFVPTTTLPEAFMLVVAKAEPVSEEDPTLSVIVIVPPELMEIFSPV